MTITEKLRHLVQTASETRYRISKDSGVPTTTLSSFTRGGGLQWENIDRLGDYFGLELRQRRRRRKTAGK